MVSSDINFVKKIMLCASIHFISSDIVNTIKIEELVVPELVQIGNRTEVILDCRYSAIDGRFTIRWLFNRSVVPVYEWSPGTVPKVTGLLEGRLDSTYTVSSSPLEERRALRIIDLGTELSGDYTCSILCGSVQDHRTKTMLVFSPEREFTLQAREMHNSDFGVICTARGVFPQPDLLLEYNHEMIPRQEQRVRREGFLFDVESRAEIAERGSHRHARRVTCRLHLPHAGYTAIKQTDLRHLHTPRQTYSYQMTAAGDAVTCASALILCASAAHLGYYFGKP